MSNDIDIIGIVISYLLGSVPFAVIVAKLSGIGDITKQGSGNPGATNMARVGGKKLGAITLILDALKGFAAAYFFGLWGAVAGVATLVGPLAGGVLVDNLGWEWIFIVNVPIGIIGLALAVWLVPALPTTSHRFDIPGVVLSGIGMFLIVFGLQEGQGHHWAPWIWAVIVAGMGFRAAFVYWQSINRNEPLIPLEIFADRDFSLSNVAIAVIGFAVTAMVLPVMFYAQAVAGLTPTRSALLTAPMAIASGVLAPLVGRIIDRTHPRPLIGFGFSTLAVALTWLSFETTPTTPILGPRTINLPLPGAASRMVAAKSSNGLPATPSVRSMPTVTPLSVKGRSTSPARR